MQLSIDFANLHTILATLYDDMQPLCKDMMDVGKGLAGLGALFYVAVQMCIRDSCCIMLYFTASYFVRFVSGTIISLFILISMKVIVLCLAVLEYKQIYLSLIHI